MADDRKQRIIPAPFTDALNDSVDRLYKNVFCSAVRATGRHDTRSASAFIIEANQVIEQIILFSRKGRALTVLNELATLPQGALHQFAQYVFTNLHEIDFINFPSVCTGSIDTRFPMQRHNSTEDIVATLPETVEAYLGALSKNTREGIRRYQKRITRNHPEIEYHFYERDQVPLSELLEIIELSRARIRQKRQIPAHTEETIADLQRMVSKYGVTLVATRNGKVCAGVICTRVHEHLFMHVVAHDPALDDLRLGKICCFLSICDAIKRGCKEYHMLSGEYDYKYQFLGKRKDYEHITLYRSLSSIILNPQRYLKNEIRGKGRRFKQILKKWSKKWSR
jgi:hypothetical protein